MKKMNTNRSAITKIFDQIRSEFTGMENSVDPNKTGSIPYQIQQERNAYAARKREEEERRRREEIIRQQREQALCRYKQDVEDDFKRQFNVYTTNATNELTKLNSGLTLENYEAQCKTIREYPVALPADYGNTLNSTVLIPTEIADMRDQLPGIRSSILTKLMQQFREQFQFEVAEYRDSIIDMLPSKKAELERMQKANEEEKLPAIDMVRKAALNKIGRFTKQDIREQCPSLSLSSVEAALRKMVASGELKREGTGKSTCYIRLK